MFNWGISFQIGGGCCRPMMPMMNSFMMNSCFQTPMMNMCNMSMMNPLMFNYQRRILPDYNMMSNAAWQQVAMNPSMTSSPSFNCDYTQIQQNAQAWAQNFMTNFTNNQNTQKANCVAASMEKAVTESKNAVKEALQDTDTDLTKYGEELEAASRQLEAIAQEIKAAESLKQDSTKWLAKLDEIGQKYCELNNKIKDLFTAMRTNAASTSNISASSAQSSQARETLTGTFVGLDADGEEKEFDTQAAASASIKSYNDAEKKKAEEAAQKAEKETEAKTKKEKQYASEGRLLATEIFKAVKGFGTDKTALNKMLIKGKGPYTTKDGTKVELSKDNVEYLLKAFQEHYKNEKDGDLIARLYSEFYLRNGGNDLARAIRDALNEKIKEVAKEVSEADDLEDILFGVKKNYDEIEYECGHWWNTSEKTVSKNIYEMYNVLQLLKNADLQ